MCAVVLFRDLSITPVREGTVAMPNQVMPVQGTMHNLRHVGALRKTIDHWRAQAQTIALVPTMGNLHAGHYALLKLAQRHASRVVVSIFVNPIQFGLNEDFDRYPRSLMQDQKGLAEAGCDLLFAPDVATMYPLGTSQRVNVHPSRLGQILEGVHRPGFFDGVATVVSKLFHLVQPDLAVFGQKDFQQFKVIEHLVQDLFWPVKLLMAPIQRAVDGLALSSRNQCLKPEERALAPKMYATLLHMREHITRQPSWSQVEKEALAALECAGFVPDYAVIRRAQDLCQPAPHQREGLVALIAARLGSTRLIDNLIL